MVAGAVLFVSPEAASLDYYGIDVAENGPAQTVAQSAGMVITALGAYSLVCEPISRVLLQ